MRSTLPALLLLISTTAATAALEPLAGDHLSACEPMLLHGRRTYTRLWLRFAGKHYASSETLYSDPKCEISVLETTSQGVWRMSRRNVLNLQLTRMQMRPLDPRLADRLLALRTCGKRWENGVANEILGTACGRGREADYFVGNRPSGKSLDLYECEGRPAIGKGCTHYGMARPPKSPSVGSLADGRAPPDRSGASCSKSPKSLRSGRLSRR